MRDRWTLPNEEPVTRRGTLCDDSIPERGVFFRSVPFPSVRLVNNLHAVGSVSPYPTVSQKEQTIHRPTSTVTISYTLDVKTVVERYEMIAPGKK